MSLFDYELPAELIAQTPAALRDQSRLMVVPGSSAASGAEAPFEQRVFADLPQLLRAGDLLVLNDTRVLAARVHARRATGGSVELLFVAPWEENPRVWRALTRPARRVRSGDVVRVADRDLRVVAELDGGERLVRLPDDVEPRAWLEDNGTMPLPPYVHRQPADERGALDHERYQTVYAREPGAVAAPTAGLHFTRALLAGLESAGVQVAFLTLEVGLGTFRPVTATRSEEHIMDGERYSLPAAAASAINAARAEGRRVIAVGTTVVRTLEHASAQGLPLTPGGGVADIYITPGYDFRVVDAMITNLHLPRSTPILLAAALVGRERLLAAYAAAVRARYRFYSYGDAMLLLP